jgi:hypothetical protein
VKYLVSLGVAVMIAVLAAPRPARAQRVSIDVMTGSAYNVPTPLTIRQDGFPDIHFTANYDTKPLGPFAPYYSWRIEFWRDDAAWEFQQVHHRLFLENTTSDVQAFAVHFGYNYFLFGRAWRTHGVVVHLSGGVIVANPSNTVRGKSVNVSQPGALDVGYNLGGVGGGVAVSRDVTLFHHVYAVVDGAVLLGHASVPVVNGSASVPTVGMHGHVGLGFTF